MYKITYKKIFKNIYFIVIFSVILISGCMQNNDFSPDVYEVIDKIKTGESEINYKEYINVDFEETQLLFNHTTEEQKYDENLCTITYKIHIQNINNKPITLNLKMFLPPELITKFVYADNTLDPKEDDIKLKANEKLNIYFGTIVKHYNKLSQAEKETFDNFRNTVYFEFLIDGKKSYTEINAVNKENHNL